MRKNYFNFPTNFCAIYHANRVFIRFGISAIRFINLHPTCAYQWYVVKFKLVTEEDTDGHN